MCIYIYTYIYIYMHVCACVLKCRINNYVTNAHIQVLLASGNWQGRIKALHNTALEQISLLVLEYEFEPYIHIYICMTPESSEANTPNRAISQFHPQIAVSIGHVYSRCMYINFPKKVCILKHCYMHMHL